MLSVCKKTECAINDPLDQELLDLPAERYNDSYYEMEEIQPMIGSSEITADNTDNSVETLLNHTECSFVGDLFI